MVVILISTCVITPLRLAFVKDGEEESKTLLIICYIIDLLFLIDVYIIFNTAFYDEYFQIIDDRSEIAKRYLSGWFTIDILAITPFDLILNATDLNSLVRFARIGRLYKLVKLTRLIRVFKIMKDKGKFMKIITDLLKVGPGFERLFFFALISMILCHIFSCLWIMLPQFITQQEDDSLFYKDSWIEEFIVQELTNMELYWTSFYFTISTITTVGYGDIHGISAGEKMFNAVIMVIGVFAFSFANGSLASIMSNYDV